MNLLPAPPVLDLRRTEYRRVRPATFWRVFLQCLRHPIIAFTVWAKSGEPMSAGQQAMMFAAFVHGLMAVLLLSR